MNTHTRFSLSAPLHCGVCAWTQHCTLHSFLTSHFHRNNGIDYMELRLWIGMHSCIQCFILVATDASYIIKYMTRFTEEGFSSLISFIFISDAIKKMVGTFKYYPINTDFKPDYITTFKCECLAPDPSECTPLLRNRQKREIIKKETERPQVAH